MGEARAAAKHLPAHQSGPITEKYLDQQRREGREQGGSSIVSESRSPQSETGSLSRWAGVGAGGLTVAEPRLLKGKGVACEQPHLCPPGEPGLLWCLLGCFQVASSFCGAQRATAPTEDSVFSNPIVSGGGSGELQLRGGIFQSFPHCGGKEAKVGGGGMLCFRGCWRGKV